VSAGNEGHDLVAHFPAAYDEVLAVTSMTDFDGQLGGLGSSADSCVPPRSQPLVTDDTATFFSKLRGRSRRLYKLDVGFPLQGRLGPRSASCDGRRHCSSAAAVEAVGAG
jgi:hypothetical protein